MSERFGAGAANAANRCAASKPVAPDGAPATLASSNISATPATALTDPEATGPAARADTRPPHFGPEALLKSVESGAIAPLRGRWVVDLDANDGRLERRQDLPPEAFFPADELRRLTEALGDDYGLLFAGLS